MNWKALGKAIWATLLVSILAALVFILVYIVYTHLPHSLPLLILYICSVFVAVIWEFYVYYSQRLKEEIDNDWVEARNQHDRNWPKEDR
jgi:uncharacterized membrane-anchored protein